MPMTIDEVDAFATALPGVSVATKYRHRTWTVGKKFFAWHRAFSKADIKRFGDEPPPAGDILAVMVENLDAKDALLAMELPGFFTIPHFNGFAAVLIQLRRAHAKDVRAAILDAFHTLAPKKSPLAKRVTSPKRRRRPRST